MLSFPATVDERAARTVATGVVVLVALVLATRQAWLLAVLAYGFWARVLNGPRFSPLGQVAIRLVVPRLPGPARPVRGRPKRFAQGVGVAFSTSALLLWFAAGARTAALVVVAALGTAAFLEAAFGLCLGCKAFALLIRAGLVPETSCPSCADLTAARADELLAAIRADREANPRWTPSTRTSSSLQRRPRRGHLRPCVVASRLARASPVAAVRGVERDPRTTSPTLAP